MQDENKILLMEERNNRELYSLVELFKMLGNPTRIHILFLLMDGEVCVSELADKLGYTQSAVSHQLNLLKLNNLVKQRRDGKMMFYTLTDKWVKLIIEKATQHVIQK